MKTHIEKNGIWWTYTETCDRCGKLIYDHNWQFTKEPDANEADFCSDCIGHLLDNDIPYEVAKQQYKKDGGRNG